MRKSNKQTKWNNNSNKKTFTIFFLHLTNPGCGARETIRQIGHLPCMPGFDQGMEPEISLELSQVWPQTKNKATKKKQTKTSGSGVREGRRGSERDKVRKRRERRNLCNLYKALSLIPNVAWCSKHHKVW